MKPARIPPILAAILGSLAAAPLCAQVESPETPLGQPPAVTLDRYDPERSWPLFASCDADADDRLDFLEYSKAANLDSRDFNAFNRLDLDSDGHLQWTEFDELYRKATRTAGQFRLQPVRIVAIPADPTRPEPESLESSLFRIADRNGNQSIEVRELRDFFILANFSETPEFVAFDLDKSGGLDPMEFANAAKLLPDDGRAMLIQFENDPASLPRLFRRADVDQSSSIDARELDLALLTLDPSLRAWSSRILADADYNGNGTLDRAEIERATKSGALGR